MDSRLNSDNLQVPYGLAASDHLVQPANANKQEKYVCPSCHGDLILKQGEERIAHFAHMGDQVCAPETLAHKTAKLLVQQTIRNWKNGDCASPTVTRLCQICGQKTAQSLPDKVVDAQLEKELPNGFVVDIALMNETGVIAAVEIRVTHSVDAKKTLGLDLPFVELSGYDVLVDPSRWQPLIDHFKSTLCSSCKNAWNEFRTRTFRISQASNVALPQAFYRYALVNCWKCGKDILVFTWPGHTLLPDDKPAYVPIPRTIQKRTSKRAGGSYWSNVCSYCGAIQGDNFLYGIVEDGPFRNFECGDDTPDSFRLDLMLIATGYRRSAPHNASVEIHDLSSGTAYRLFFRGFMPYGDSSQPAEYPKRKKRE